MIDSQSELIKPPVDLSLVELVGLREPNQANWANLRVLQYGELHKLARSRAIAHSIALLLAFGLYMGKAPIYVLLPWLVLVVAGQWNASRIDKSLADLDRRTMSRYEFRRQAWGVAGSAAGWALALLVFPFFATSTEHLGLWCVVAMLMAGSALAMSPASVMGFQSWLEAGPPGTDWDRR